jgi:6-pyruvoyltetrahydropterin/6-carboxytetrahydropterin synthase
MHGLSIDDPKLNFSSAHFIGEHDKCERIHGHNYRVKIELKGGLNDNFMVIDFNLAKERVKKLCDRMDHKILLPAKSQLLKLQEKGAQIEVKSRDKFFSFPKEDCELLPIRATTAEEIAKFLFDELRADLEQLKAVYVAESEGSTAFYLED